MTQNWKNVYVALQTHIRGLEHVSKEDSDKMGKSGQGKVSNASSGLRGAGSMSAELERTQSFSLVQSESEPPMCSGHFQSQCAFGVDTSCDGLMVLRLCQTWQECSAIWGTSF